MFGSTQEDDFKSHGHGVNGFTIGNGNSSYGASNYSNGWNGVAGAYAAANGGTETRPKNIALLYCIKY